MFKNPDPPGAKEKEVREAQLVGSWTWNLAMSYLTRYEKHNGKQWLNKKGMLSQVKTCQDV